MGSAAERRRPDYQQTQLDRDTLDAAEKKRARRRGRNLETGWLRQAQQARADAEERARRSTAAGPTSNLPVPAGDAERITAAELAADEAV